MGWLKTAGSFLFGGGDGTSAVSKSLDIAKEYVEDVDKRNDLAVDVIKANLQADSQTTVPWVDALHKMGRQLMTFALMAIYYVAWESGHPMPIEDLVALAAGPGAYILLKGRGK